MPNERKLDLLKDLNVSMSLRKPQVEALAVFSEVLDLMKWDKAPWVTQSERIPQSERDRVCTPEQIAEIDERHSAELRTRQTIT